jgi:GntR family transcriptional regulator
MSSVEKKRHRDGILPLHHQLYVALKTRLTNGTFAPDQPIPGEHQLAERFGMSRVTVRRTLKRLEDEGLIDRRPGVGTFPKRPTAAPKRSQHMSYYDYVAASSRLHEGKILEYAHIPTPPFLLEFAGFGPVVLKLTRLSSLKLHVSHLLHTYVPADIAQNISKKDIKNRSMLELLKKSGIEAATSELTIGATAAGAEEAQLLEVAVGAPLLEAVRVSFAADGQPIEYNHILSRVDLFAYRFVLDQETGTLRPVKSK